MNMSLTTRARRIFGLGAVLLATVAGFSSPVNAVSDDGWRTWDDMTTGSYAVVYGTQAKIYECFLGKGRASLQVRNKSGRWRNMQTVTLKKSKRCDGDYVALFNGRVTVLGQRLDDGLYLEMRIFSPAGGGYKSYTSPPALIPQYKSRAEQIQDLGNALRDALAGL
jgi:hypothetical protein